MDEYKRQRCGDLKMAKLLNPVYVPDEDMSVSVPIMARTAAFRYKGTLITRLSCCFGTSVAEVSSLNLDWGLWVRSESDKPKGFSRAE
jgi:hypothetical protein